MSMAGKDFSVNINKLIQDSNALKARNASISKNKVERSDPIDHLIDTIKVPKSEAKNLEKALKNSDIKLPINPTPAQIRDSFDDIAKNLSALASKNAQTNASAREEGKSFLEDDMFPETDTI